jgi:zinc transport system substrate-binding protein
LFAATSVMLQEASQRGEPRVKRDSKRRWIVPLTIGLLLLSLSAAFAASAASEKIGVAVGIPPIAFFVERIGGDQVTVQTLLAPGQSPETYSPTPVEMARLSKASLYFEVGVPFEQQLAGTIESAYPHLLIVDLRSKLAPELRLEAVDHQEDDPHYWLNPRLMEQASLVIRDALTSVNPSDSSVFAANCDRLIVDLKRADSTVALILHAFRNRDMWVFHPAYGYFARAYGLQQVAIQYEGKEPTGRELASLVDRAKADKVRTIFVQPQFSEQTAETIARQIGARIQPLDPLAHDYLANLIVMAKDIAAGLGGIK